jgi:molybdate transport system substrate-binding protein
MRHPRGFFPAIALLAAVAAGLPACRARESGPAGIEAFCGAASEPVLKEAAKLFEKEGGVEVTLHFSGSGTMLSQMKMSRRGDVFIPASSDYMEKAVQDGVVEKATERILAYLVPVIAVGKGNPKNLRTLGDLARPGVRVALGEPRTVVIGLYAVEILQGANLLEAVGKNVVTLSESAPRLAALIPMKTVDAVIGWDVFAAWNPDGVEIVHLEPGQIPRIAYLSAAVSTFSTRPGAAKAFVDFLAGDEVRAIFRKNGYIATEAEALKLAPRASIGGSFSLPENFTMPVRP